MKRRRWARRLGKALAWTTVGLVVSSVVLFWAVHRFPSLGPALADGLRVVFGPRAVAHLESWAYALDDRWQRLTRRGEAPHTYWEAPPAAPQPPAMAVDAGAARVFVPRDVGPMSMRAAGDGRWVAVPIDGDEGTPMLYKSLLHPDTARPWAELFVVAIDASRVRLHLMAGVVDPEAETPAGKHYARPALIPVEEQARLVAAFNGGWKAEHGHFGMKVDGVTLLSPRDASCTVTAYDDDTIRIATWTTLAPSEPRMVFYRQTPPCLYSRGVRHRGLSVEETVSWGAAVGGSAVIRRSAIGLDEQGETLYVGVSNSTTAPAIADGMHHAGAYDIAELDVNWSYPKFLVFRRNDAGALEAETLFPGFVFEKDEYVRRRAPKDFFYFERR